MLSGIKTAFFYQNIYFLLPEEYGSTADFLNAAHQTSLPMTVQAVVLRENSKVDKSWSYELGVCLAPYFIADYLKKPESIAIEDSSDIFPVQVELLSQQEYNNRLRARVTEYCPGCRGFGSLSEKDSSLSGHFNEISLNGFCPYRWETRTSPRCFYDELTSLSKRWELFEFSKRNADQIMDYFKTDLKLTYASGALYNEADMQALTLSVKKSAVLITALTDLLAGYIREHADAQYSIRLTERAVIDESSVAALLTPKKIAASRKEFKKYGVAIGILEYASEFEAKVTGCIDGLVSEGIACILCAEPGKIILLLTAEGKALMRLRYASPLLEKCGAAITVYGILKTSRYQITFDMPETILDLAPVEEPKPKKPSKKLLKAEEGKVLKRNQVQELFQYVEIRLSSEGCDHTARFTELWLKENLPAEQYQAAIEEIQSMGGYCDCELLLNCYEEYELDG